MRFLLIRNDVLGDAIVSSTFIESLAKSIVCQIDVLCHHYNEVAFRHNPYLTNIFISKHQQDTKQLAEDINEVIQQIRLKVTHYDAIFVLNPCLRSLKYAAMINAGYVFGRRFTTRSFSTKWWFFAHKFSSKYCLVNDPPQQHEVHRLQQLLKVGLTKLSVDYCAEVPVLATFYLPAGQIPAYDSYSGCVINVSGKFEQSRYINDSMLYALVDKLLKSGVSDILLVATATDQTRVERVLQDFPTTAVAILVTSDLLELAKKIVSYRIFIGCDGGLAHLAAGLGLYCITLFDRQDAKIWHPWSDKQISLQSSRKNIYDLSYLEIIRLVKENLF